MRIGFEERLRSLNTPGMVAPHRGQGQTGRFFQIRVGSGSGIGKNFGSGLGLGLGIGTVFFINRVLSGNENIDRVFSGISISRLIFQN